MSTPAEEIGVFLEDSRTADGRKLDVAILYARAMVTELRRTAAEWEATAQRLHDLRRERLSTHRN